MHSTHLAAAAAVFLVWSSPNVLADLDKDRKEEAEKIEKEARPELDPGPGEDEHEAYHHQLAEEGRKTLREIERLLEEIHKSLGQKETGAATQSRQKKVVERLEELATKLGKQCSRCSGGGSTGNPKSSSSQEEQAKEKDQKPQGSPRKNQDQVAAPETKPAGKDQEPRDPGKVPNDRTERGKMPETRADSFLEKLLRAGRWGFLPPKLREEILSAGAKEAPLEYREIIDRYYRRLSETHEGGGGKGR